MRNCEAAIVLEPGICETLTDSLAESNAEAEVVSPEVFRSAIANGSAGAGSANKDRAKLEQRLLAAVSDLQLAQKERDQYRDQMLRLSKRCCVI
jgi:predicted amino acid-binding ACT domain protein